MKMHEYNRRVDLDKLNFMKREQAANDAIWRAERADLAADKLIHDAAYRYYGTEMAYQDARKGRIRSLTASTIRELTALRNAEANLGIAQKALTDRELNREQAVLVAQKTLFDYQDADYQSALRLGTALTTARTAQLASERLANAAGQRALTAQAGVIGAQTTEITRAGAVLTARSGLHAAQGRTATAMGARLTAAAGRIGTERTAATEGLEQAQLQRRGVLAMRQYLASRHAGRTATLGAAGRALAGEAGLQQLASRQRLTARRQQYGQEVGEAAVSGAARGFTGSFQAVQQAQAQQRLEDDMARFRAEDHAQSLQIAHRSAEIAEQSHLAHIQLVEGQWDSAVREAAADTAVARARVALSTTGEATADVAVQRAQLAERVARTGVEVAQVQSDWAGLTTRGRELTAKTAQVAYQQAQMAAGVKALDAKGAEIAQVQDRLRASTRQGRQQRVVAEIERAHQYAALGDRRNVAQRQRELVTARYAQGTERILREGTQQLEELAVADLAKARSQLSAKKETREKGRTELQRQKIGQEIWLQNFAETMTRWQASNLPSADEYKSTGRQSPLGAILSGIATILG